MSAFWSHLALAGLVLAAAPPKTVPDLSGKVRSRWTDDGSLEVVTQMEDGPRRTEIFEMTHDGRRLFVLIGLEGRGPRPIQFRRVYDRMEEEKKSAPEPG